MTAPVGGVPAGLTGERARLYQAAQALEAVFMQQMLQAMREATPPSGLVEQSSGEKVFQSMFDEQMAQRAVAQDARGLAAQLYRQLSRHLPAEATTATSHPGALEATDAGGR